MNFDEWKFDLINALHVKLKAERDRFSGRKLLRFDVGVFPWHGSIELSFLFSDDDTNFSDIASWPQYNMSKMQEGKWPEAAALCSEMAAIWNSDSTSSKIFFIATAEALKAADVQNEIDAFDRDERFEITLFNSDDRESMNYYV